MKKEERKLEVECCTIARKYGGGCGITWRLRIAEMDNN